MQFRTIVSATALALTSIAWATGPAAAAPSALDEPCRDVEVIVARGSGQDLGSSAEMNVFIAQLATNLGSGLSFHAYELGTEDFDGYSYPAVNVSNLFNGNALGAFVSAGQAFDYGDSVHHGIMEMISYAMPRAFKCDDSRFVLAGYSQGAQVIGESLDYLSSVEAQVDFVALFGDPRLYLPEGQGIWPAACRGEEYSPWRRDVPDCRTDNGSLGARKPYLPVGFLAKTGLWCNNDDFVCGSSKIPGYVPGHGRYAESGNGAEQAALEAAQRIDTSLGGGVVDHIVWDVGHGGGDALDVLFVLDTTGSMGGRIAAAKQFASQMADAIEAANGRVALVTYKDAGDVYTARIDSGLTDDLTSFKSALNRQSASGGGDTPEAMLHALMTGFNGLEWRDGATKAAIVLTDAAWHDPDRVDGTTLESMAARSLEIDPVNVYPVVPASLVNTYSPVAQATSGKVIVDSGNTVTSLMNALTEITERPVALLRNRAYAADTGQQVTFDASRSYGVSGAIEFYDWDFDGDSIFDARTTEPTASHVYTARFEGSMQVKVTDAAGRIGSASVPVSIGRAPATVPAVPTVTVEADGASRTATVAWSGSATRWLVAVEGVPLGITTSTSIQVTDLERDGDVRFSIAPVTADGTLGAAGEAMLAAASSAGDETMTLHTTSDLSLTNAFATTGADGDVVTAGDFACDSSVSIAGSVTVGGDARLTNECSIAGDLVVGGDITLTSRPTVGGSVLAAGDIRIQSSASIGQDLRAAGDIISIDGRSDAALAALGTVGGALERDAEIAPFSLADAGASWLPDALSSSDIVGWTAWLNATAEANEAPRWATGRSASPGCTMASGAYSVGGPAVTVPADTVIDARAASNGCTAVALQGMELHLAGDLTIVADGLSTINGLTVDSADGARHELRLIAAGGGATIEIASGPRIDPLIGLAIEAPTVVLHSGTDARATVRAATFRSDGAVALRSE